MSIRNLVNRAAGTVYLSDRRAPRKRWITMTLGMSMDLTESIDAASSGEISIRGPVIWEIGIPSDRKFHASCTGH